EDELPYAALQAALQEIARRAGVIPVVFERLADGLRDYRMSCEVQNRVHLVRPQRPEHLLAVADLAEDQRRVEHRLAEARREVIEHDDALATRPELQHDVTADVAGSAGD